ncbi:MULTISPECIES: lycopene cyclase family protein [Corynebacterium]|uniref:lycopene cyclase family protein n=1 Tax=Corynebacterium TaxID=1716 RepID=UPI00124C670B|nr:MULTISPECIES: lycopene cyclase family protein [Corynebacterium]
MRIAILGLGPAGAMVALRAAARGWEIDAYDPRGLQQWSATYGLIDHQLPAWLEPLLGPPTPMQSSGTSGQLQPLPFCYRMLDNAAVHGAVERLCRADRFRVHTAAVHSAADVSADAIIDCRGANPHRALWQVAVGRLLPAAPPQDTPVFMDWRQPTTQQQLPPSFLYTQRVQGQWLWEETILATDIDCTDAASRRHLLALLRERLNIRLADHLPDPRAGAAAQQDEEIVFIPMGTYGRPLPGAWACGARAGSINPATGYSVADTARSVDPLLDRLAAAEHSVLPALRVPQPRRWLAHLLRNIGAQLITQASGPQLQDFFGRFFSLPAADQLAYVTGEDPWAVARTMVRLQSRISLRHPFLCPLWRRPWAIVLPALLRSSTKRRRIAAGVR